MRSAAPVILTYNLAGSTCRSCTVCGTLQRFSDGCDHCADVKTGLQA